MSIHNVKKLMLMILTFKYIFINSFSLIKEIRLTRCGNHNHSTLCSFHTLKPTDTICFSKLCSGLCVCFARTYTSPIAQQGRDAIRACINYSIERKEATFMDLDKNKGKSPPFDYLVCENDFKEFAPSVCSQWSIFRYYCMSVVVLCLFGYCLVVGRARGAVEKLL